jgi:hypothetical protein
MLTIRGQTPFGRKLAAGHYRVVADFGGVKRGASIDVKPGEPANLYLRRRPTRP